MHTFATMEERHAFGLEALAEMTGKLVQATYLRAVHPRDPEDQDRALLLFDRMARSFRLTLAMEAREARARRRDAEPPHPADASPPARAPAPRPHRETEAESEADDDREIADLPGHIRDLKRAVVEHADMIDPDGAHLRTIDRWEGAWGDVLFQSVREPAEPVPAIPSAAPIAALTPDRRPLRRPPRRASG